MNGKDLYHEVINHIEVMDEILEGHNNGDINID